MSALQRRARQGRIKTAVRDIKPASRRTQGDLPGSVGPRRQEQVRGGQRRAVRAGLGARRRQGQGPL